MKKSRRNFLKKSILGLSTIPSAGFISKSETFTSLKKNKIVAPCIKQYLISHVQGTNGMTVEGTDQLKFVIFLPIENFNTSKQKVWKDSLGML